MNLLLADSRTNPNANISDQEPSAFLIACIHGHSKCVETLLHHKDINPNENIGHPYYNAGNFLCYSYTYNFPRTYTYFQLVLDRYVYEKYIEPWSGLREIDYQKCREMKKILGMLVFAGAACDETLVNEVFLRINDRDQAPFTNKKSVRKLLAKLRNQYVSYKTEYSTYFIEQNMQRQLLLSKTMQDDAKRNGAAGLPVTLDNGKIYNFSVGDNITKFLAPPVSLFEFCMQQYKLEQKRRKSRKRQSDGAASSASKKSRNTLYSNLRF